MVKEKFRKKFYCYSFEMAYYLIRKGVKPEWIDKNPQSDKIYFMFDEKDIKKIKEEYFIKSGWNK